MRMLIAIAAVIIAVAAAATTAEGAHGSRLLKYVEQTHRCQDQLHITPTKLSGRRWRGDRFDRWRLGKWWQRKREYCGLMRHYNRDPRLAIAYVFGPRASEALRVSKCETGGTYWVGSANGQYLGIFQMGASERSIYGHGPTALEQAFAAHDYFVRSGRDWSPWSCKPW